MIFDPYTIVEVPFPFIDHLNKVKKRKALVLSTKNFNLRNGATVLCMITSAKNSSWFGDVPIHELEPAGLRKPCVIRFKLFTLENSLILGQCGKLGKKDVQNFLKMKEQVL
jgi:mRNA interferase MazF